MPDHRSSTCNSTRRRAWRRSPYQGYIDRDIGPDLSSGFEWRPRLNNNIIILGGIAGLVPGGGFRQLYNQKGAKAPVQMDGFVEMVLTY